MSMTAAAVEAALQDGRLWQKTLERLERKFPSYRNGRHIVTNQGGGEGGLEETTQDALLEALAQPDSTFNDAAHLERWVYQVAERNMKDKLRGAKVQAHINAVVKPRRATDDEKAETMDAALDRLCDYQANARDDAYLSDVVEVSLGGRKVARMHWAELEERIAKANTDPLIQAAVYDHLSNGTPQAKLFAKHVHEPGQTFGARSKSEASFVNLVKTAKAQVIGTLKAERDATPTAEELLDRVFGKTERDDVPTAEEKVLLDRIFGKAS